MISQLCSSSTESLKTIKAMDTANLSLLGSARMDKFIEARSQSMVLPHANNDFQ